MKWVGRIVLFLLAVSVLGIGVMMYRPVGPDSFILTGGTILTLNPNQKTAEAVRVEDGRITGVGKLAVLTSDKADIEVVDLDGGTLIPGLIEPHTHPIAAALLGATVDVSGFKFKDRASIMRTLKDAAGGVGLTPWIVAYGWDPLVVADLDAPTLEELDAISPDKPLLILTQMMHEAFANSAALEAIGMDVGNPEQVIDGYPRDANGRLTGVVKEVEAIGRMVAQMPTAPGPVTELLVRLQYIKYSKAGYTTIGVTGAVGRHSDPVGMLEKIGNHNDSPVRTVVYLLPDQTEKYALKEGENFEIKGIKFWMDGSPFTGGAAMDGTYENSELVTKRLGLPHNHTGSLNYTRDEFKEAIKKYHAKGYQIAVHVQGERAIEEVLVAIEAAQDNHPNPDLHHRLEHNALITKDQLARVHKLGMTLGFFVDHIYYYGDVLPQLMGAERMARYMPLQSAIKAGIPITLHGDHPATPIGPFRTFRTAVDRKSESGSTANGMDEKISKLDALKSMTINAAIQLDRQNDIGSLEVGKKADLVILSENPLEAENANLPNIEVKKVWKNGQYADTRLISATHLGLVWDTLKAKILGPEE